MSTLCVSSVKLLREAGLSGQDRIQEGVGLHERNEYRENMYLLCLCFGDQESYQKIATKRELRNNDTLRKVL